MFLGEAVANRTRKLLFEKNISQYTLIKKTCISKTTIQDLFHNKIKYIRITTVYNIAQALGMTLSEFFDDDIFRHENIELE